MMHFAKPQILAQALGKERRAWTVMKQSIAI